MQKKCKTSLSFSRTKEHHNFALFTLVEYVKPSPQSAGDWWSVFVAAVPCFNQQATLAVFETVKKESVRIQ
jgi:hypothetical protein